MLKKRMCLMKKIPCAVMAWFMVSMISGNDFYALDSKDVFMELPASRVLSVHQSDTIHRDRYSNVFSLKQFDGRRGEFLTPSSNTEVNATELWHSDIMGSAIATQSPYGILSYLKDHMKKLMTMLYEVKNPKVIVLGPTRHVRDDCDCHGAVADYFSEGALEEFAKLPEFPFKVDSAECESTPRPAAKQYGIKLTKDGKSADVAVTHFSSWADKEEPGDKDGLEALIKSFAKDRDSTLIVHCSAGVGRTGVFMACLYALKTGTTNPVEIVKYLREHRTGMVQSYKQFDYICKFILRNLCGMSDVSWDSTLGDEHFARMGVTKEYLYSL